MSPSLLLLLRLSYRARLRRHWRSLTSPRHAALAGVSLVVLLMALSMPIVLTLTDAYQGWRIDPELVREGVAMLLLLFFGVNLLSQGAAGVGALSFEPSEIDLLFPAPYARRELLAYKLIANTSGLCFNALALALMAYPFVPHATFAFAGGLLALWFIDLAPTAAALASATVGERTCKRAARWGILVVLAGTVFGLWQRWTQTADAELGQRFLELRACWQWQTLLAPFALFSGAMTAPRLFPEAVMGCGMGLLLDLALIGLIVRLDATYLETALRNSQRIQRQRLRQGAGGWEHAHSRVAGVSWRLPMFPYWEGAGPIFWRQSVSSLRRCRFGLLGLAFAGIFGMLFFIRGHEHRPPPLPLALLLGFYLTGVLCFVTCHDFRRDLDHLEGLKTLPIPASAIAAGELLTPVVVSTATLWIYLAGLMLCFYGPRWDLWLTAGLALSYHVFSAAFTNLAFLLYPVRPHGPHAKGLVQVGRELLLFSAQATLFVLAMALAFGAGAGVYFGCGKSVVLFWLTVWGALTAMSLALIPALGRAFERFDASRDMPAP